MKRRAVNPLAVMVAEERGVVLAVAVEQRVPDVDDLTQSAVLAVLRQVARGSFAPIGDDAGVRATIRAYLVTTARRLAWERWRRAHVERVTREPLEPCDPRPRFEARSELRALDLPPVAVAFFQAIVHEGNVRKAALRLGWRPSSAYARRDALRQDALAALHRIRRRK